MAAAVDRLIESLPLPRSRRLAAMPATASRIDDCLSIREGRLWIEECDAVELARRFGTPVYVVSEDQLRRNARRIAAAFADRWPEGPVTLLPSLKANLSLALRRILNSEGLGCDTFGPGELHAALASGIDPALVSVNGSAKDAALVRRAVEAGARITLDSRGEIDLVSEAARAAGRTATVRLRLRPDYDGLDMPSDFDASVSIRDGAHRYKPGIPLEQAADVARKALADDGIELAGVMAHLGRHSADPEVWRAMAGSFAAAIGRLSAELDGWRPAEIDVGGGFAAPRDPTGPGDPAPPIEDVAAAITAGLRDGLAAAGIDPAGIRLEAEPGRALYADCGIHLATVRNLKHQAAPVAMRWVETDTTEMFMADLLIEHARFGVIDASRADSPTTETADVVGMSCGFDVLVPDARLPKLRTGDVLAFLDTGAYQDACASNFNGLPRPGTVLVSGARRRVDQAARDGRGRVRAGRRPGAARVIGGLHHVGITVSDLDRSLAFYRGLLGLHIEARAVDVAAEDVTGIPGARCLDRRPRPARRPRPRADPVHGRRRAAAHPAHERPRRLPRRHRRRRHRRHLRAARAGRGHAAVEAGHPDRLRAALGRKPRRLHRRPRRGHRRARAGAARLMEAADTAIRTLTAPGMVAAVRAGARDGVLLARARRRGAARASRRPRGLRRAGLDDGHPAASSRGRTGWPGRSPPRRSCTPTRTACRSTASCRRRSRSRSSTRPHRASTPCSRPTTTPRCSRCSPTRTACGCRRR